MVGWFKYFEKFGKNFFFSVGLTVRKKFMRKNFFFHCSLPSLKGVWKVWFRCLVFLVYFCGTGSKIRLQKCGITAYSCQDEKKLFFLCLKSGRLVHQLKIDGKNFFFHVVGWFKKILQKVDGPRKKIFFPPVRWNK